MTTLVIYMMLALGIAAGSVIWVTEHLDTDDGRCIWVTRLCTMPWVVLAPILVQLLARPGREWAALIIACFATFCVMNLAFLVSFVLWCPQEE